MVCKVIGGHVSGLIVWHVCLCIGQVVVDGGASVSVM